MNSQLGIIGLGTMGANLARNAARNGAKIAIYNRTPEKTDAFINEYGDEGEFVACKSIDELVKALEPPRPILIMVKAGKPVDDVINELTSNGLTSNDILIDGGNSHFKDTERRVQELSDVDMRFIGMGVSGGEEGALNGPSMMPGGDSSAIEEIMPLLQLMAADDPDGGKCITFIGPGGAGHFVKMVHNGIEYAIMQLIAESYDILKSEAGKTNAELSEIFSAWNEGDDLNSYLMEITARIFSRDDDLVDVIRDSAGQKGTGKWTTEAALDLGVPVPTINAAVDARILSGWADLREKAKRLPETIEQKYPKPEKLVSRVRIALELSIICAYQQGFTLMERASTEYGWNLKLDEVARIWQGGCIIRSEYLKKVQKTYQDQSVNPDELARFEGERQLDWRRTIQIAQGRGIPVPAMSSALNYYDAIRRDKLPQNLIQAQRDFFGAHGFERVDQEGVFHGEWMGS